MSAQQPPEPDQNLNISESVFDNVQIGGLAGRDQTIHQYQGPVYTPNVFNSIDVGQTTSIPAKRLSQQEYRWRQVLLEKVKHYWIEGVLEKSLHTKVLIELGLEERINAVESPLSGVAEFPEASGYVFPEGTQATDIFEKLGAGRTLLILGEPGAGKTTTLLKLTQSIIAQVEAALSQPIPVVLNLSSWAKKRQSIADWLVQELYALVTS